jgi:hypothetical protein
MHAFFASRARPFGASHHTKHAITGLTGRISQDGGEHDIARGLWQSPPFWGSVLI